MSPKRNERFLKQLTPVVEPIEILMGDNDITLEQIVELTQLERDVPWPDEPKVYRAGYAFAA